MNARAAARWWAYPDSIRTKTVAMTTASAQAKSLFIALTIVLIILILVSISLLSTSTRIGIASVSKKWLQRISRSKRGSTKVILFWTGFYDTSLKWKTRMGEIDCGQQMKCFLTPNHSMYKESNALIFHHRCLTWLENITQLSKEKHRILNQRWVLYNRESAWWEPKGSDLKVANELLNWTMGFRRDDDIYIPTAIVRRGQYRNGFDPNRNYMASKTGHVAALMSMCRFRGGYRQRSLYINLLKKSGLEIDMYGKCGERCGSHKKCSEVIRTFKFVLAIENSLCDDYISEKPYINGLQLGTVPIVLSKANVSQPSVLPPGSFIDASQFPQVSALVKYVNKVGKHPRMYNNFFKWRAKWSFRIISEAEGQILFPDDYFCPLCKKLHDNGEPLKIIKELQQWYEQQKCKQFPTQK